MGILSLWVKKVTKHVDILMCNHFGFIKGRLICDNLIQGFLFENDQNEMASELF